VQLALDLNKLKKNRKSIDNVLFLSHECLIFLIFVKGVGL